MLGPSPIHIKVSIPIKKETDKSLEETYNDFIKQADKLKTQSRGRINLYKSGSLQKASLALFFYGK